MDPISSKTALAAAGAGEKVYVDDLFSTTLYEGTGNSGNTVDTGIQLDEEWLIWQKNRSQTGSNFLTDSSMTKTTNEYPSLVTNTTSAQATTAGPATISGSTVEYAGSANNSGETSVVWSFKAAPGFFDVVTYTGDGTSGKSIAHNLGSVPGMIIVKRTDSTSSWAVFHRSLTGTHYLELETTFSAGANSSIWNNTNPTSTHFTVGNSVTTNANNGNYVAYVFAHNDQQFGTSGNEAIVHCGTFNGGGSLNSTTIKVNTGFEPQFVLIRRTDSTSDWYLYDTMRGLNDDGNNDPQLVANKSDSEAASFRFWVTENGFAFDEDMGGSSAEWIYMAIRRPHKPPEAGTDVFTTAFRDASEPGFNSGFPVDLAFEHYTPGSNSSYPGFGTRLTGRKQLVTSSTASEVNNTTYDWDYQAGWNNVESTSTQIFSHMFKRAPGFLDVITWSGNNTVGRAVPHNLESAPELVIIKSRSSTYDWVVWHKDLTASEYLYLNSTAAKANSENFFNNTSPDASDITFSSSGYVNGSGETYTGAFFATLSGISKVGSYTGNGTSQVIDCGFTAGARFVLIKSISISNDWRVFDTVRGINASANDPVYSLNNTNGEDPNKDWLRPNNSGFEVNTSDDNVNGNNTEYLFLAIA